MNPSTDAWLDPHRLPARLDSVEALEELLSRPSAALVDELAQVDGDLMILGVGGKMGPTLARLAKRAAPGKRIIGVARFSDAAVRDRLHGWGVETIAVDLLDRAALQALPRVANIVFAAGHKFGASGNPALTWAMNTWLPGMVAETFAASRIVAFSTGNVYPLTAPSSGGAEREQRARADRRIRAVVPGPRASVRVLLRPARHARAHLPPELRDRSALRRVARHRDEGASGRAGRSAHGPCQHHLAG